MAALLRPPFFALDLADLVRARAPGASEGDPAVARVRAAEARIRDLRRARFERPVGATARDLLEATAFGRAVALGENGGRRLEHLRELCLALETLAAGEGLDYDAATARLREWVLEPVKLDPPAPLGDEAVQVMTVHQAKGLEFPVVALWDGRGSWQTRLPPGAWQVARDGRGYALELDGVKHEEPPGAGLRERERGYQDAERRRVAYVAATRARDLLVVPRAGDAGEKHICGTLVAGESGAGVRVLEPWVDGRGAPWAKGLEPPRHFAPAGREPVADEVGPRFAEALAEAARPRFRPSGVVTASHARAGREAGEAPPERKPHLRARFGTTFGEAVHRGIGIALQRGVAAGEAARLAAREVGLAQHVAEAEADVARALAALKAEGLASAPGAVLRIEFPIAGAGAGGTLLGGFVDLLRATDEELVIVDFKTDPPPRGPVEGEYGAYVAQVRTYAGLLEQARVRGARRLRAGLLFTADGGIRWCGP
jgi:ATP-dependent helicase/nuclease subunit A